MNLLALPAPLRRSVSDGVPCLVLSPHLDDAVLSCGALLTQLAPRCPVTVVTVFSAASLGPHTRAARSYLRQCAVDDAECLYSARREEDRAVLASLGVQARHLEVPDALFRRRRFAVPGLGAVLPELEHRYPTYRWDIARGRVARADRALVTRLGAQLDELVRALDAAVVLSPLGVGRHVDHLICRTLGERYRDRMHYSDFPYNQRYAPDLRYLDDQRLEPWSWDIGLDRKMALIGGYRTQAAALFRDGDIPLVPETYYVPPAPAPPSRPTRSSAVCHRFAIETPGSDVHARWEQLAVETGAAPFLRPGWVNAWTSAFGQTAALRVATVRRNGALVAALPVLARRGALVGVANAETPAVGVVAADKEAARQLAHGLLGVGARRIDLTFLDADGTTACGLRELDVRRAQNALWQTVRYQPFVNVGGDLEEYERRRLSAKRRSGLRRLQRRLAEAGTVDFTVTDGGEQPRALAEEGFALEARGWKGRAGTAVQSRRPTREFYAAASRWAADAGILRLAFLRLDGAPLAFALCLEQHGVLYGLKLAYDEQHAPLAPGIVLIHRLLEHAFWQSTLRRMEMLGEAEGFKLEFADGTTEQLRARFFRPGYRGVADRRAAEAVEEARNSLRMWLPEPLRAQLAGVVERVTR
jgi:CelD/BcsL family acetyltransferase involved in cellulose biosynthesis/LmbE family N-acetylglucosaminyl deacetylase